MRRAAQGADSAADERKTHLLMRIALLFHGERGVGFTSIAILLVWMLLLIGQKELISFIFAGNACTIYFSLELGAMKG